MQEYTKTKESDFIEDEKISSDSFEYIKLCSSNLYENTFSSQSKAPSVQFPPSFILNHSMAALMTSGLTP